MDKATFKGGIHPAGHKELTSSCQTIPAPVPERVYIPLSQHIGAPCVPLVVAGDRVRKGQRIGEGKGFVTAPVHATVSGTVESIIVKEHPGGSFVPCIVIRNDRLEEWDDTIKSYGNPASFLPEELRQIIFNAGIVGMGGASFPVHVKLSPPEGTTIDTVILNGIECEPYLTADHRLMLEQPEKILAGLGYIMRTLGCQKGIIAIEDNKPDAVSLFSGLCASLPEISVKVLREKYPQGSEKQLIFACTARKVPEGGLPLSVGVVVNNVGTAAAIADAVERGLPLIQRYLTVSGTGVKTPANYLVRIGTLFSELIELSGGYNGEPERIIAGGPMMGKTVFSAQVPVVKGSSGIVVLKKPPKSVRTVEYPCVRCARCIDACPAFLEPTSLVKMAKRRAWDEAESAHVMSCIECGSCVYSCPSIIPLLEHIRRAKQAVLSAKSKA